MNDEPLMSLPRIVLKAALTDFMFVQGSDFDAPMFPGMDRLRSLLDSPDAARVDHRPGDFHAYRIFCTVCGGFGQVVLSIEPQRVPDVAP